MSRVGAEEIVFRCRRGTVAITRSFEQAVELPWRDAISCKKREAVKISLDVRRGGVCFDLTNKQREGHLLQAPVPVTPPKRAPKGRCAVVDSEVSQ